MKCDTCLRTGEVLVDEHLRVVQRLRDAVMMIPCPECGGSGQTYCCEGDCGEPGDPQE